MIKQKHRCDQTENDKKDSAEQMSDRDIAKLEKVERRRSIEEYISKRRWKEENEDLADLYDAECY